MFWVGKFLYFSIYFCTVSEGGGFGRFVWMKAIVLGLAKEGERGVLGGEGGFWRIGDLCESLFGRGFGALLLVTLVCREDDEVRGVRFIAFDSEDSDVCSVGLWVLLKLGLVIRLFLES